MLRVGTLNLLSGRSLRDGRIREADLRASAAELDVDVLGLQEVDRHQPRSSGVDQAAVVAEAMAASWHRFVPALHGTPDGGRAWVRALGDDGTAPDGPSYGVALVSRLPVREARVLRLPGAPLRAPVPLPGAGRFALVADEPRVALAAVVETGRGPVTVVTTHLSFVPGWNVAQLRRVTRWATALPAPRLLVGDLNLPGRLPARLTGWAALARTPTYPSPAPRVQLDHVLADGMDRTAVHSLGTLALPVSDHCALTVSVALEPGETSARSATS